MARDKNALCRTNKLVLLYGLLALGAASTAEAFELSLPPDWAAHWDNTISYNLGVRAQGIDPQIGNNPLFSESDYKFKHAGDVVTNKVSDLSEFDAVYRDKYGFRISASVFKDFAYGSGVGNNPGQVAPGLSYSTLGSYANNRFSSYTERYYSQGIQLLDAFAFGRFDLGGHNTTIKLGQLTQFWGNAVFFGSQGINYSQNATDNIKGSGQPGAQAKELALPRLQALVTTEITHNLSVEGQYFLRAANNLLPEGGTYLGTAGFLFNGPQFLQGQIPHGADIGPSNTNPNYGIKTAWSPDWLRGVLSFYYRRFDEVQPWAPLFGVDPATRATNYHLAYATDVHLYGVSLEKQIGDYSTGFELSFRQHTGLNSASGPLPSNLAGTEGARGNTINLIANIIGGLTPTPFYQTGSFVAEVAATHLLSVTSNPSLYNGTNNSAACPSGSRWAGCSTTNSLAIAAQFDPTWLQVWPGVDIDMPIFATYGLWGNTPSLGGSAQGSLVYTAGIHALVQNKYNITLQYNGYHAHTSGGLTNISGVPVGTPGYPSYYAGGNGGYFYNDKGWVSLTLQMAF